MWRYQRRFTSHKPANRLLINRLLLRQAESALSLLSLPISSIIPITQWRGMKKSEFAWSAEKPHQRPTRGLALKSENINLCLVIHQTQNEKPKCKDVFMSRKILDLFFQLANITLLLIYKYICQTHFNQTNTSDMTKWRWMRRQRWTRWRLRRSTEKSDWANDWVSDPNVNAWSCSYKFLAYFSLSANDMTNLVTFSICQRVVRMKYYGRRWLGTHICIS